MFREPQGLYEAACFLGSVLLHEQKTERLQLHRCMDVAS
ncbi:MAG: hypothetical protein ACI9XU_002397 [Arenicella sp.]|jgi:hypothetical protein